MMLKAIHAQESKEAAREKVKQVAAKRLDVCMCQTALVAGTQWGTQRHMNMDHLTNLGGLFQYRLKLK